jgi:predicted TIM-barrel fold metal-dependent hydrolase
MIVDAQVHVWAPETPQRPWLRAGDAHLAKPFGYDDLAARWRAPASIARC